MGDTMQQDSEQIEVNWADRRQVRELVKKHGLILRQGIENGVIEQAQLDVDDELHTIAGSLDESQVDAFHRLYDQESTAAVAKLNRESAELGMKAAEIEMNTAVSTAQTGLTGVIVGAILLAAVVYIFFF